MNGLLWLIIGILLAELAMSQSLTKDEDNDEMEDDE